MTEQLNATRNVLVMFQPGSCETFHLALRLVQPRACVRTENAPHAGTREKPGSKRDYARLFSRALAHIWQGRQQPVDCFTAATAPEMLQCGQSVVQYVINGSSGGSCIAKPFAVSVPRGRRHYERGKFSLDFHIRVELFDGAKEYSSSAWCVE